MADEAKPLWEVWVVPVPPEGNFLYKEERKVYEHEDRENCAEWLYFTDCDEPAPDKYSFRKYEIRQNGVVPPPKEPVVAEAPE